MQASLKYFLYGRINTSRGFTRFARLLLLTMLVLFATFATEAQKAVPELWGNRVHDEAHVLSAGLADQLDARLRAYEDSTSNQIAVLIVSSLDGEVIEDYSMRVVEHWKLGQKGKDNGVLLLAAIDDRKMRIEVGYGLEGVLPDAVCDRIIRNEIAPHFRQSDYDGGITAAIDAITEAIAGEYKAAPDAASGDTWKVRIFVGLIVFFVLGIFTVIGLFLPGKIAWFLYAFLIPFYATFPLFVFGVAGGLITLATYLVAFPIVRKLIARSHLGQRLIKTLEDNESGQGKGGSGMFPWQGPGWSSRSGGSWGSGRSGGGGFSGGGGSFGGGGSSGSW